jgi:hypothetical protein
VLPFDPGEVIQSFWSERYKRVRSSSKARARRAAGVGYYAVRPMIPRSGQIALRRALSRVQARSRFPRWPVEPALHELYGFLFDLVADVAEAPVPRVAPWPHGRSWALVLTHDVETHVGHDNLEHLRALERSSDLRSAWNFVPRRYRVDERVLGELTGEGCEVGVHGLYHDGRDVASPAVLRERLPAIRAYAERWGADGFRSPATRRVWELMDQLGFDHDSSYPDTDPFEPDGGGCCTWLPFFNGKLVELPITLPQDHTLFTILRHDDERAWLEKAEFLRSRGGMALIITHPDYTLEPKVASAYERFLAAYAGDETVWHALPREVSGWWRRRAASRIERVDGEWQVVGAAAGEATVELVSQRRL